MGTMGSTHIPRVCVCMCVCVMKTPKWPGSNLCLLVEMFLCLVLKPSDNQNLELPAQEADSRHSDDGESHHHHLLP